MTIGHDPVEQLIRAAGRRVPVGADRAARVRDAVHEEWLRQHRGRRRRVTSWIAAAAAVAIVMIVAWPRRAPFLDRVPEAVAVEQRSGRTIYAGAAVMTGAGESRSLAWGGQTLRLDATTRVVLHSSSEVSLQRGALYYSSERGTSNVVVNTPFGSVRDLGTQFQVRLLAGEERIAVREGRVELQGRSVTEGTELIVGGGGFRMGAAAPDAWMWVERAAPPIRLDGMTLGEVLQRIAREKGLRLDWHASPSAKNIRIRGNAPLSIAEALQVATAATSVRSRVEDGRLVVEGR